jgi:hypothetical protein
LIDNDLATVGGNNRVLGIIGYSTGSIHIIPIALYYGSSSYSLQLRNISNNLISNTITIVYLYKPI